MIRRSVSKCSMSGEGFGQKRWPADVSKCSVAFGTLTSLLQVHLEECGTLRPDGPVCEVREAGGYPSTAPLQGILGVATRPQCQH